ncbi:hypothetical protein [Streptomyces sp. NPDC005533]|uniref:hypothetical protein n=1 Tax=Streptomyces sp. NPDC005533 TaxID=3364723 RepID=UPI0036806B0B
MFFKPLPGDGPPRHAGRGDRLWPVVVAAMPSYAAYRAATAREIPLVLVTRTGRGGVT